MGLTENWASRVEEEGPSHRQLLLVRRLEAGLNQPCLKEHDVLLALNGKVISRISELDASIQQSKLYQLTILRENQVLDISIPATLMEGNTTKHLVMWAGAIFHGTLV
jgi:S1-C subfamily serine protease